MNIFYIADYRFIPAAPLALADRFFFIRINKLSLSLLLLLLLSLLLLLLLLCCCMSHTLFRLFRTTLVEIL